MFIFLQACWEVDKAVNEHSSLNKQFRVKPMFLRIAIVSPFSATFQMLIWKGSEIHKSNFFLIA